MAALAAIALGACNQEAGVPDLEAFSYEVNLEDSQEKLGYALGVSYAKSLKQGGLDSISKKAFIMAMNDVKNGTDQLLTDQECQAAIQDELKRLDEIKNAPLLAAGKKYLEENAKKSGVTVTESGLQYEVITEGSGPKPTTTDRVQVHYHGTLLDGTVFDSSVDRGEPTAFGVTQVIRGWTEALQLMPVGSKWKLTIPQDLAYGPQARGKITPYSTLIFEVELLGIE